MPDRDGFECNSIAYLWSGRALPPHERETRSVRGGVVTGPGTSLSDDAVPAFLDTGYIIPARVARRYGRELLARINRGEA